MCAPKIIFDEPDFNVTQCPHCHRIGLYYGQVLVRFKNKDFTDWVHALNKVNFKQSAMCFPDGELRVVLNTCHQDIQFNFKEEEFDRLVEGVQQALLVLEAIELTCHK